MSLYRDKINTLPGSIQNGTSPIIQDIPGKNNISHTKNVTVHPSASCRRYRATGHCGNSCTPGLCDRRPSSCRSCRCPSIFRPAPVSAAPLYAFTVVAVPFFADDTGPSCSPNLKLCSCCMQTTFLAIGPSVIPVY